MVKSKKQFDNKDYLTKEEHVVISRTIRLIIKLTKKNLLAINEQTPEDMGKWVRFVYGCDHKKNKRQFQKCT